LQRVESRGCILCAGRVAKKRTITVGGVETASRVAKEGERSISRIPGASSVA
jgi:hypothetical protein